MSVSPTRDRRAERHEATRAEILEAAWELAREQGLAGLSLRDLGERVGMRAQSLYSYFDSKHAIYDAMFAQGNAEYLRRIEALEPTDDPRGDVHRGCRLFFDFCTEDPERYQLLFQRTLPGFEPSPEAWAISLAGYDAAMEQLRRLGLDDPAVFDLMTGLITGLTSQQISNDPGGDRWSRLLDDAVDMFLEYAQDPHRRQQR
jgi:AcrR family transcriptional regulator